MPKITAAFTVDNWEPSTLDEAEGAELGQVRLTKTFTGAVEGTSTVTMLSAISETGQAYVAFERFSVSVEGRKGGFVLQHAALADSYELKILPGSGIGELAGITGSAMITKHEDGGHTLELDYLLD
ncbi:DUF3224 domain-containing protein [Amycolatopsis albispora]|uniref:DUF3224 domain-containing protein n=1 Tax=Amycolatopsis albispora TaxID=1804986 RepID=A0A344L993_9PSEU|nr:DUF3224 domain-containing protein [Amycolatopsis albispora]AXB44617.1 hypothetical protein A4R43_20655 [Amycolatopsis albispora]